MEIRTELERLEELFQEVNKAFFNNALTKPVITYNPDEKGKTLGHFVAGEIWHNRNKQNATELNIVCTFKRGKESIIETMLHECVHLFCYDNKIKDTSNRGVYHNKNFKNECLKHGLDCQKGKYGYSSTSLNERGKEFAKNCKINLGYTHRDMLTKPSNKQKAYKYECPICHAKWRTTKNLVLFCSGNPKELHKIQNVVPEEINGEEN